MTNEDNIRKIESSKKHILEDDCTLSNQIQLLKFNNTQSGNNNNIYFSINKKKKIGHLSSLNNIPNNIFKNSDIICNLLAFFTFSERWKFKLLNKSFYVAFNTKYAWANLDFRFVNVDLFNFDFLRKYNKLFFNTFSLSLSVNGTESIKMIINLIIKHFKYLKDLRLYFRKKNTNFIYEGVHPIVSNILNYKILKEKKKENRKEICKIKSFFCSNLSNNNNNNINSNINNSVNNNNNNNSNSNKCMNETINDEEEKYAIKNNENNDKYHANGNLENGRNINGSDNFIINKNKSDKLNFNKREAPKYTNSRNKEDTNEISFLNNLYDNNNGQETNMSSSKNKNSDNKNNKNPFSFNMLHGANKDEYDILSYDFINTDSEFNNFFLEHYFYKYIDNKNELEDNMKMNALLQKYINIIEGKKIWRTKNLKISDNFENLERLIIDVELKGEDLLCFVGKLNNLKDIIISKLLYSNKLNRSQNIIIFTCFIEKMKQNNIRLIQLGLYFRHEYKPTDFLNNEKFRKILSERKEYVYDINKEEGDELIYILQKNHLNSLYCLWSNDLFISFEMYEQIKKFHNLKIWILPGWRALSLAKQ